MEIMEYSLSSVPLEDKEKFLFEIIDKLDKESYKLYCEIIDLSDKSFYKVKEISRRIIELGRTYKEVKEAYEYLDKIEQERVVSATKRLHLKSMLTGFTVMFAFINNVFLGVIAFILLNSRASKDYVNELEVIRSRYSQFDDDRISLIGTTIGNCDRLFCGKVQRMNNLLEGTKTKEDEGYIAIITDGYITLYLNGEIDEDRILSISDKYKEVLKDILKKDLNSNSDDLLTLLRELKEHNKDIKVLEKSLISKQKES